MYLKGIVFTIEKPMKIFFLIHLFFYWLFVFLLGFFYTMEVDLEIIFL